MAAAAAAACEAVLDTIEQGQASGELDDGMDDRAIAVMIFDSTLDGHV